MWLVIFMAWIRWVWLQACTGGVRWSSRFGICPAVWPHTSGRRSISSLPPLPQRLSQSRQQDHQDWGMHYKRWCGFMLWFSAGSFAGSLNFPTSLPGFCQPLRDLILFYSHSYIIFSEVSHNWLVLECCPLEGRRWCMLGHAINCVSFSCCSSYECSVCILSHTWDFRFSLSCPLLQILLCSAGTSAHVKGDTSSFHSWCNMACDGSNCTTCQISFSSCIFWQWILSLDMQSLRQHIAITRDSYSTTGNWYLQCLATVSWSSSLLALSCVECQHNSSQILAGVMVTHANVCVHILMAPVSPTLSSSRIKFFIAGQLFLMA